MKTTEFDFDASNIIMPDIPNDMRGKRRDHGRMVVLDRKKKLVEHKRFDQIVEYLRSGDILVLNNSRVLPNFLDGYLDGAPITLILQGRCATSWITAIEPDERAYDGARITDIGENKLTAVLSTSKDNMGGLAIDPNCPLRNVWSIRFEPEEGLIPALLSSGKRLDELKQYTENPDAYAAVYADKPGSCEIPTAGLHFTKELLDHIKTKGVTIVPITLHVGMSEVLTFRHIESEEIEDHRVSSEWYEVSEATARAINEARKKGGRVIAVGTTVVRTLETITQQSPSGYSTVHPGEGWTSLYIYPGYSYKCVDVMLTNLHLPRSSHIVLVSAFCGKDFVMKSYEEILDHRYEFDMFGDSMLIV